MPSRRSRRSEPGSERSRRQSGRLAPELQLVPGWRRRELEQRTVAAGLEVRELGGRVVPRHVEPAVLDAGIEPGAAEDELAQPVDERLAVHERQPLPVAHQIAPELAARLFDQPVGRELDEVVCLLVVELVVDDQPQPVRGGADALREVGVVEAEAEAEELDDDLVARAVVVRIHAWRIALASALDWG